MPRCSYLIGLIGLIWGLSSTLYFEIDSNIQTDWLGLVHQGSSKKSAYYPISHRNPMFYFQYFKHFLPDF